MSASDFSQRLVQALGPDTVFTDPADITPWLSDWRGLYNGQAQAVVRPRTTAEVATCLALCQEAGVPVVPRGGNT
uniref:FAD-binding oxidoreductase n=2 Tax=Achromobacter TaxID=222 RepID=UPI0028B1506C